MKTNEIEKLFEAMLYLEKKCEAYPESKKWFYESDGAFFMLEQIGLAKEYINWAIGK